MIVKILKEKNESLYVIGQVQDERGIMYRVLDDETGTPYLLNDTEVELIDPSSPPRWLESRSKNRLERSFPEFLQAGFWEDYFDNEIQALNTFSEVIVPIDKTWVAFSHLDSPDDFTWSNIKLLLQNKWCPCQTAIDLAIHRIQKGVESAEEVELAGLSGNQANEVLDLVSALSRRDKVCTTQLLKTGVNWVTEKSPKADIQCFSRRFENSLAGIVKVCAGPV